MERTRPRHSMPNSLAPWIEALAGSMPTKSHTPPRVGRCRAYGTCRKQALSYWELACVLGTPVVPAP